MVPAAEAPRASLFGCAQTSDSTEHYDLKLAPARRSERRLEVVWLHVSLL